MKLAGAVMKMTPESKGNRKHYKDKTPVPYQDNLLHSQ